MINVNKIHDTILSQRLEDVETRIDSLENLVFKRLELNAKLAGLQVELAKQQETKCDDVVTILKSWHLQNKITVEEYKSAIDVVLKIK